VLSAGLTLSTVIQSHNPQASEEDSESEEDERPRRAPAPKKKGEAEKAEECKNQ
jgi:hypothetical protein